MKERVLDQVVLYLSDSCPRCSKKGFYGGGEFALPPGGWSRLLSIAQVYGWEPVGTRLPEGYCGGDPAFWQGEPSEWDGRYWPGYGQEVTAKDALDLAAALKRAWPDLPEQGVFQKKVFKDRRGGITIRDPEVTLQTTPFELYSGEWREPLGKLAAHITRFHCLECAEFGIWSHEKA